MRNIYIILPAYNESENIPPLLESFANLAGGMAGSKICVIVVDDGSSDGTAEKAGRFSGPLRVLVEKHERNRGLGAALRTGFARASFLWKEKGTTSDVLVTMDADMSHPPELIPQMLAKIDAAKDVVIASRYEAGGGEAGLSVSRKFLSRGAGAFLRFFFPIPGVRDYTCGYRMIRLSLLANVAARTRGDYFKEAGFVATAEFLLNLHDAGARISEVPLLLRYDLKRGASKMRIPRTIFRYFLLVLKRKLS